MTEIPPPKGGPSEAPVPVSVLISGANGFVGSALCREFLRRGAEVHGMIREQSNTSAMPIAVERHRGSFHRQADARRVLQEARPQTVIHCAAIVSVGKPNPEKAWRVNVEGTRIFAHAAREAGVTRWVQISSMSAHSENKSVYGSTKFHSEAATRESGIPLTIIRPSLVYSAEPRGIFHKLVSMQRKAPVLPLVGDGSEPMRPIHVDDLAWLVAEAAEREQAIGKTYDAGGPEEWTLRDMLKATAAAMNKKPRFLPIPLPICRIIAFAGENLLKNPPLTSDNIAGIAQARKPCIDAAQRDLGFAPRPFKLARSLPGDRPNT